MDVIPQCSEEHIVVLVRLERRIEITKIDAGIRPALRGSNPRSTGRPYRSSPWGFFVVLTRGAVT